MKDEQIDALRKRWLQDAGQPTPLPSLLVPLTSYSDLLRLLGKFEGLLLGTGLQLQTGGEQEWGQRLVTETDRLGKKVDRVTGGDTW